VILSEKNIFLFIYRCIFIYNFSLFEIPSACTQQSHRRDFAGAEAAKKGLEGSRGKVLWREDTMSLSPK